MQTLELGGLTVRLVGGTDREGGGDGPLVVLLHGFGAPGDDLVALHRVLDVPREVRFAFPHALATLEPPFGDGRARAWWMIDVEGLERAIREGRARDLSREMPVGIDPAREAVVQAIAGLREKLAPSKLVLGGFSQGAMLATDVALRTDLAIDGLVLMSGTMLAEDVWPPLAEKRAGMPAMISHGTHDPILPYEGAERLAAMLKTGGLDVDFVRFRGQHEIPPVVLDHASQLVRRVIG
jgi:phospholipase/carboxylesterase